MTLDDLQHHLKTNATTVTADYTRLFHGRGNAYEGYNFLTIDSVEKVLFAVLFEADDEEEAIVSMLRDFNSGTYKNLLLKFFNNVYFNYLQHSS